MDFLSFLHRLMARQALRIAALFSLGMLSAALAAQYGFGLAPCHLCMLQRYPYAAIAALALITAWRGSPRTQLRMLFCCAGLFFLDAALAFYHTGVELHWFPGPAGCTSASHSGETLEQLRAELTTAALVTCDQAMAYIFGFSLAAWNFLAATIAGIATFFAAHRLRKKSA
jgi:disulfide bond formation protein DsbB